MEEKLQELQEMLDINMYQHGLTTYNIIEKSNQFGKRSYQAKMLQMCEFNGIVFFEDEESLLNSNYKLRSFLVSSLKSIIVNKNTIKINFNSGESIKITEA